MILDFLEDEKGNRIISFYRFEATDGANTFSDVFNLNNLTSTSVTDTQALVTGQFGSGMNCEGLNASSALFQDASTQNLSFGITNDFSISFWIRRISGDADTRNPFVQFNDFSNLYLIDHPGGGAIYVDTAGTNFSITGVLNSGGASSWKHVLIRFDRDLDNSTCVDSVRSTYTWSPSNGNSVDALVFKNMQKFCQWRTRLIRGLE